jgi:hypothetical protein
MQSTTIDKKGKKGIFCLGQNERVLRTPGDSGQRQSGVGLRKERFEPLRCIEFFGILRCAQDDGRSFL